VIEHRCAREGRCVNAELVEVDQCAADCECHWGPYYPCSVPGGCGHLHEFVSSYQGAPIVQYYGLCMTCTQTVTNAIADLPQDYVSLRMAQHRGLSPASGELVMATKDLPIPISLTLTTLADQIEVEVSAFAEPVAEKLNIDWDKSMTPKNGGRYTGPVILDKSARLLVNAVDVLLSLPVWEYRLWGDDGWAEVEANGVEAGLTLLALHQATRSTLGLTRSVITMQAACPFCSAQSLVKIAGQEMIQCQLCWRYFSETEYEQWTLVLTNGHHKPRKRPKHINEFVHTSVEGSVGRPVSE
jgi:hypothetical protein